MLLGVRDQGSLIGLLKSPYKSTHQGFEHCSIKDRNVSASDLSQTHVSNERHITESHPVTNGDVPKMKKTFLVTAFWGSRLCEVAMTWVDFRDCNTQTQTWDLMAVNLHTIDHQAQKANAKEWKQIGTVTNLKADSCTWSVYKLEEGIWQSTVLRFG